MTSKGDWRCALSYTLWDYRTSYRTTTGYTPFSLSFGAEAKLPVEVDILTRRRISYDPNHNNELLAGSLDFLDERRNEAGFQMAAYQ